MEDAKAAVSTGVDGIDLVIGTSSFLREFSHGKSMEYIKKSALEVIAYVKRLAPLDLTDLTMLLRSLEADFGCLQPRSRSSILV